MSKYDDIIRLSRPVSEKHPRMSMTDRAAQFSPFAALTGYDAAIEETVRQLQAVSENTGYAEFTFKDEKIHVNIEKVVPIAKEMLTEIIKIQMNEIFEKAENYVLENFVWSDEMEIIAHKLQKINKTLNGKLETKLTAKIK